MPRKIYRKVSIIVNPGGRNGPKFLESCFEVLETSSKRKYALTSLLEDFEQFSDLWHTHTPALGIYNDTKIYASEQNKRLDFFGFFLGFFRFSSETSLIEGPPYRLLWPSFATIQIHEARFCPIRPRGPSFMLGRLADARLIYVWPVGCPKALEK